MINKCLFWIFSFSTVKVCAICRCPESRWIMQELFFERLQHSAKHRKPYVQNFVSFHTFSTTEVYNFGRTGNFKTTDCNLSISSFSVS